MPPIRESSKSSHHPKRALSAIALTASAIGMLWSAALAPAAPSAVPSVASGFTITKIAAPLPSGAANCDDLGFLDGHLFMGCQNKTGSLVIHVGEARVGV